ncbi:hypothetical protein PROFUN_15351 [Planoprotostelium fungivorum]|uniref:Uncharacterized protein n=1 Tax=Planoprotostelium fungivorum TaxID=1890364 RepID=A0A2P6MWR0_9EUKA|nr:hypothetical protein PROFUN_15351 [Planoprotostelium fungivorum]
MGSNRERVLDGDTMDLPMISQPGLRGYSRGTTLFGYGWFPVSLEKRKNKAETVLRQSETRFVCLVSVNGLIRENKGYAAISIDGMSELMGMIGEVSTWIGSTSLLAAWFPLRIKSSSWCTYCNSTHNAQVADTQTHIFIDCPTAKNSGAPFHIHADVANLVVRGSKRWLMYPPLMEQTMEEDQDNIGLKYRLNIFQPTPDNKDPKYNSHGTLYTWALYPKMW